MPGSFQSLSCRSIRIGGKLVYNVNGSGSVQGAWQLGGHLAVPRFLSLGRHSQIHHSAMLQLCTGTSFKHFTFYVFNML